METFAKSKSGACFPKGRRALLICTIRSSGGDLTCLVFGQVFGKSNPFFTIRPAVSLVNTSGGVFGAFFRNNPHAGMVMATFVALSFLRGDTNHVDIRAGFLNTFRGFYAI